MTIHTCIALANDTPTCYLATTEGDQPHVRALGFWFADETGFYFQTGSIKSMTTQLKINPKTEVCWFDEKNGKMLRVTGEVEFLEDRALKEKCMKDRPFLANMGLTADSPDLIIFRIAHGEAYIWTFENNLKPKKNIKF